MGQARGHAQAALAAAVFSYPTKTNPPKDFSMCSRQGGLCVSAGKRGVTMKTITISREEFAKTAAETVTLYTVLDMQFGLQCAVVVKDLTDRLFGEEEEN